MIRKVATLMLSLLAIATLSAAVWSYLDPLYYESEARTLLSRLPKYFCSVHSGRVQVVVRRNDPALNAMWVERFALLDRMAALREEAQPLQWIVHDYISYHPDYEEKKGQLQRITSEMQSLDQQWRKTIAGFHERRSPRQIAFFGIAIGNQVLNVGGCVFARQCCVSFPILHLFVILSIYPTVMFAFRGPLRRHYHRKRGRCVHCGYNLIGNLSG